jgi:hypothetical protein
MQRKVCDGERLNSKLRDDLENVRSKEASAASKYQVLLGEIEQVRKNFQSQEHM